MFSTGLVSCVTFLGGMDWTSVVYQNMMTAVMRKSIC